MKRWIYSGQLSPVAELDSANNVTAQFVGSLMIKNGNTYQLITDHLGSVRLVVDVNTGDIAQQIDYDEFGNVLSNTNPDLQPFGFAGGMYDIQTKLVRIGARDYEASVGRWENKDQILFFDDQNLYAYVCDEPINRIDIYGLYWEYSQGTGNMTYVDNATGARTFLGTGHAGNGLGKNNPSMENVKYKGPLPKGCYTIADQGDYLTKKGTVLEDAMVLNPDKTNKMYNRSGFLIHGGTYSQGCIILAPNLRNIIGASDDNRLHVVQ